MKKISASITETCILYPKSVIFYSLLSIVILMGGLPYVHQDDDIINLLPEDIGSRQVFDEIQKEYGLTEYMYVAVGNNNTSILNKNSLKVIWDLTKEFEQIRKNDTLIVDNVISISNFNKIYLEIEEYTEGDIIYKDSLISVDDLMESKTLNNTQIKNIDSYLNDNPIIKKRLISKNGDYANIIIIPMDNEYYPDLAREIHRITDKYKTTNSTPFEFHFGGQAYVTGAVPDMVQSEVKILLVYGLLLMTIILFINLRSIQAVFLILVIILFSMMSMFGFMGWVYHFTNSKYFFFTLMNTSMPIVLLTIANSVGVHIISKFIRKLRKHRDKIIAIKETMKSLHMPIFLTSLTTALAFLTLYFSPVSAMIGYGITIGFGIMCSWILSNTLLPALIVILNWDVNSSAVSKPSYIENMMTKFGSLVSTKPKNVLTLGAIIVVFSIIGIQYINVEVQYNKMFKKGNVIRDSAEFLDENMTGNVNLLFRVRDTLDYKMTIIDSSIKGEPFKEPKYLNDIALLQNFLDSLDNVKTTISINDIVKQLHKVYEGNNQDYYSIPDSRQKVSNLFAFYEMNPDENISSILNDYKNETIITALMSTFSTQKVPEYQYKIQDFINDKIDNKNLTFELTGMMAFIVDFMWLVVKSSIMSLVLSILVIFITASAFFKSWRYGIMAIIPLTAAVALNFGLMGWFGIELTHITALLTSIIIGVGVDFSIHYISEYKNYKETTDLDILSKETIDSVGYPIILDAWSNMAFGALLLSSIIPLGHIGGLMVLAMISTSIGALTLLAAALELSKNKMK